MDIDYKFKNPALLELALTHCSYGNEFNSNKHPGLKDNEQLELLGDAILDLVITEMLLETHPHASEGDLSKMRAGLVNEKTLALVARSLRLGNHIRLGKGEEQTGGQDKDSILSSSLEALIAAIYRDSDHSRCFQWVRKLFKSAVEESKFRELQVDYKTRLQELTQSMFKSSPKYSTISSSGPDHDKTFIVELQLMDQALSKGTGKSKKEAEQDAARVVVENIGLLNDYKNKKKNQ